MKSSLSDKKITDPSRGLERSVVRLSDREIKLFLSVLAALMRQVPCPKEARNSYLREIKKRLQFNGVGFISDARVFPTLGLRILGKDTLNLKCNFKLKPGQIYPSLLAWYWRELVNLSSIEKPSKVDAVYARKILSVLSFARMIRVSSLNLLKKSMKDFLYNMENPTSESSGKPFTFNPAISLGFSNEQFVCELGPSDFSNISVKPSALKGDRKIPMHHPSEIGFADGTEDRYEAVEAIYYKGPYGNVRILTENGGKTRTIVPYNSPFVHSVSLYKHVRKLLNLLPQDVSIDQKRGHDIVRGWSANEHSTVSADLTAMTDRLSPKLLVHFLNSMNLRELVDYLFNLPVIAPNGVIITPQVLLMGFKGNFELGSLLHHWYVKRMKILDYVMCGDDLAFQGNLEDYETKLYLLGPSINRNKTVVSTSVSIFCGEYYWKGHCITPCAPKLHSMFSKNKKVASATIVFSCVRMAISRLSTTYKASVVWRITREMRKLLRERWPSYIGINLPVKLRGLGYPNLTSKRTSLIRLLMKTANFKTAALSVGVIREIPERTRWFGLPIQIDESPRLVVSFIPSLLKSGVSFDIIKMRKAPKKDIQSLDLYDILRWYYDDIRVPLEKVRF
jgi:hypothetical protein